MLGNLEYLHVAPEVIVILLIIIIVAEFSKYISTLWGIFASKYLGVKNKITTRKNLDNAIVESQNEIIAIKKQQDLDRLKSEQYDKEIKADVAELKGLMECLSKSVLDVRISQMRTKIIDFAIDISSGKKQTRERYKNVMKTYHLYEDLIEKNNLTNDEVTISYEIIQDAYKDCLRNQDFIDAQKYTDWSNEYESENTIQ